MKKLVLYASVIGLIIGGVIYLIIKKNKSIVPKNRSAEMKPDSFEKEFVSEPDIAEEIRDSKNSSAQSVHDRHMEAAGMMYSAFENIYKDTEPLETDGEKESVVAEAVVTNNKLNSLSDELDDLLN